MRTALPTSILAVLAVSGGCGTSVPPGDGPAAEGPGRATSAAAGAPILPAVGPSGPATGSAPASRPELPPPRSGADVLGRAVGALLPKRWLGDAVDPERGRPTLVRFWTDTCPFCEASLPALEELRTELGPRGLQTAAVYHPKPPRAVDDETVAAAADERGYHGPIAIDDRWTSLENIWLGTGRRAATSASFLLDGDGVVRFVHPGPEFHASDDPDHEDCDADWRDLRQAVEHLLFESSPTADG